MQFVRCGKSKVLSVCIFAESGQIGADSLGWVPFFVGLLACSSESHTDVCYLGLWYKIMPPSPWWERSESAWARSVLCLHQGSRLQMTG